MDKETSNTIKNIRKNGNKYHEGGHFSKEGFKEQKKSVAKRMKFHHPGTKYLPIHPIHRGEEKDE